MKKLRLLSLSISLGLTAALCAPFASTSLRAQTTGAITTPRIISYQGVLDNSDGTPVKDGNYSITVRLYSDKDGTNQVWQGTYTVPVTGGVFNIALGGGQQPLPDAKTMDQQLWLSTQIGEGQEMRPFSQLSASAYALNVPDNSITAKKIAANYVGSLSVNGQQVSTKGGNVNFTAGSGVSLNFDPTTNAIIVGGTSTGTRSGKGGDQTLSNVVHGLTGTENQVLVDGTYGIEKHDDLTLSLPQSIGTGSSPSFDNLTLSGTITSAATTSEDPSNTLTTKGYVDNEVNTAVSGTANTMAKFTDGHVVGNSSVTDDGTTFGINANKFTVDESTGNTSIAGTLGTGGTITDAGDLSVAGASTMSGTAEIDGQLTLDGLSHLSNPFAVTGILAVDGSNHVGYRTPAEIFSTAANNWILNQNSTPQLANFQIGGMGTAAHFNAVTNYEIGGMTVLNATTLGAGVTGSSLTSLGTQAQALDMGTHAINNVADPTNAQDAATKHYVDNGIATETARAETAEATNATAISNETTRAEAAETTNANAISAETNRAETAEATNATAISNETTRAEAAETTNANAISAETNRAETAEATNATAISNETTRAEAAETTNANAISAETNRAETAEATNATAISNETTRAEAAETTNANAISAETNRAETAESTNATAISNETTRAEAAETTNANAISAETNRAETAESTNATAISNETTRAEAAETTNANAISAETGRAEGAEATLTSNLSNEVSRAEGAESTLTTNLNNEVSRAEAAEATKLSLSGGTMSGAIDMGTNAITNMADPTNAQDAATKNYVDNASAAQATALGAAVNGIPNTMAKFTGTHVVGNSALTDDGTTLSYSGANINAGTDYQIGGSTVLSDAGTRNLFAGVQAGASHTTGSDNAAVGFNALNQNTSADANSAYGSGAMANNTTAGWNVAVGAGALTTQSFSNGGSPWTSANVAVGMNALQNNQPTSASNGRENTGLGTFTLESNTTGADNLAVGYDAGQTGTPITTGNQNTLLGAYAQVDNANAQNRTAIGSQAVATADNTIQLGNGSVTLVNTSGSISANGANMNSHPIANVSDPTNAQDAATKHYVDNASASPNYIHNGTSPQTGNFNISGTGTAALFNAGTGYQIGGTTVLSYSNTSPTQGSLYVGPNAGASNSNHHVTAVGVDALSSGNSGYENTAVGHTALQHNTTGNDNDAVGGGALYSNTTGGGNNAMGETALASNTSGSSNTALGTGAMITNVSGSDNTAVGSGALYNSTSSYNVALGTSTGQTNTTGSANTFVGYEADAGSSALTNATAIGNGATVSASNTIQLGNSSVTTVNTSGAYNTSSGYQINGTAPLNHFLIGNGSHYVDGTLHVITATGQLQLQETGDVGGESDLFLQNRYGSNGALFEDPSIDVVDLGFMPSSGAQWNLRFEHRSAKFLNAANTSGEFQILPNSLSNPNPVLAIGESYTTLRTGTLDVKGGSINSSGAITAGGTVTVGGHIVATSMGTAAVSGNAVTVTDNPVFIITGTSSGTIALSMPGGVATGDMIVVIDQSGNAAQNGSAAETVPAGGSRTFYYNGSSWQ